MKMRGSGATKPQSVKPDVIARREHEVRAARLSRYLNSTGRDEAWLAGRLGPKYVRVVALLSGPSIIAWPKERDLIDAFLAEIGA